MSITSTVEIDPKYLTINPFGKPESIAEKAAMANGLSSAFAFMPVKDVVDDLNTFTGVVRNHCTEGAAKGALKTLELQKTWFENAKIPHIEWVNLNCIYTPSLDLTLISFPELRNVLSSTRF